MKIAYYTTTGVLSHTEETRLSTIRAAGHDVTVYNLTDKLLGIEVDKIFLEECLDIAQPTEHNVSSQTKEK